MNRPRPTPVVSTRALNRALLARQLLLERTELPAAKAIEHLVGMQAQTPESPYYALWARLRGFRADELAGLLQRRRVVRLALMRSTIHLVSARDCLDLRPVLQPVQERNLFVASPYGRRLAGMDLTALARAGRALLEKEPMTIAELAAALRARWPARTRPDSAAASGPVTGRGPAGGPARPRRWCHGPAPPAPTGRAG